MQKCSMTSLLKWFDYCMTNEQSPNWIDVEIKSWGKTSVNLQLFIYQSYHVTSAFTFQTFIVTNMFLTNSRENNIEWAVNKWTMTWSSWPQLKCTLEFEVKSRFAWSGVSTLQWL